MSYPEGSDRRPARASPPGVAASLSDVGGDRRTSPEEALAHRTVGLVDAVDHLLNRGACVVGDATISLGGVDLIYLGLSLVVSSVETMRGQGYGKGAPSRPLGPGPGAPGAAPSGDAEAPATDAPIAAPPPNPLPTGEGIADDGAAPEVVDDPLSGARRPAPEATEAQNGLARLVLTLVELLRQILER